MWARLVREHFSIYHISLLIRLSIRKWLRAVISLLQLCILADSLSRYQEVGCKNSEEGAVPQSVCHLEEVIFKGMGLHLDLEEQIP